MTVEEPLRAELADFPPTVMHIEAVATPKNEELALLPWVQRVGLGSLWRTALQVTTDAEQIGARFSETGLARAATFAFAAELLAVGSVSAVLFVLGVALFPHWAFGVFTDPEATIQLLTVGVGLVVGLAGLMVALHWLWALGVELGAKRCGLPLRYRGGLCLASYACGWDLITSPFGVALLLVTGRRSRVGATLAQALRAPRVYSAAFMHSARAFSAEEQRRVVHFAIGLTGPIVLVLAVALLVLLVVVMA